MKKWVIFFIILLGTLVLYGRSLWRDSNLFSDRSRLRPGDILKIVFAQKSLVRYKNETKTGKILKISFGKPGMKIFSFLPSVDYNATADRNNRVDYSTENEFYPWL